MTSYECVYESTLPRAISTDSKRLQQVIKNLLSNAFKFTQHGKVGLRVERVRHGWRGTARPGQEGAPADAGCRLRPQFGGPGGPNFRLPQRPGGGRWAPIAIGAAVLLWLGEEVKKQEKKVTDAEARHLLRDGTLQQRAWVISHLLRYAQWDDIWTFVSREEVREIFGDLDLPENLRNAWARMLKVEAHVG